MLHRSGNHSLTLVAPTRVETHYERRQQDRLRRTLRSEGAAFELLQDGGRRVGRLRCRLGRWQVQLCARRGSVRGSERSVVGAPQLPSAECTLMASSLAPRALALLIDSEHRSGAECQLLRV
jgi:hypothetical protein